MSKEKSYRIPKRRLFAVPLPKETRTYKPVSHKSLAQATLKGIKDAGFKVDVQEYYSAREGAVATARYTIKDIADEDMQLEIGWQNSYDKTMSLKFAIGTRIFICANGCVSGNFGSFAKKHMADVKTFAPEEMKEAIKKAGEAFSAIKAEKDTMKSLYIGKEKQAGLVGELFMLTDFVGPRQLTVIKEEMAKPTYAYGAPESMWEIYQYVTFSMKDIHPTIWMEKHIEVHKFFVEKMIFKRTADHASLIGTSEDESFIEIGYASEKHINENQIDLEDSIKEIEVQEEETEVVDFTEIQEEEE